MHWILDVVFSEDSSAVLSENSLKSLNILRKFALMAHKKYVLSQPRKKAYKTSMFDCLLNDNRLLEVLKNLWNGRDWRYNNFTLDKNASFLYSKAYL